MPLTAEERRLRRRESQKKWRAKNKERIKEYNQRWWAEHPDHRRLYRHKRYLSNRERELEYSRNYRRKHPDRIRELQKKYHSSCYLYPRRSWSKWEDMLVLEHAVTDMQLSQLIERSIASIQTRRYELKKKLYQ